jgi:Arc/MetJ family transcription regulator
MKQGSESVRTTIDIDDHLLRKAMRLCGHQTKKATVDAALQLLVQTHAQEGIRRLKGKVRWDGNLEKSRRGRPGIQRYSPPA